MDDKKIADLARGLYADMHIDDGHMNGHVSVCSDNGLRLVNQLFAGVVMLDRAVIKASPGDKPLIRAVVWRLLQNYARQQAQEYIKQMKDNPETVSIASGVMDHADTLYSAMFQKQQR